ncbi:pentatricopeptide repeat-containing protein At1g71460, chloroplastic [Gastrolobium bilobum]|uniref:pentatricopeptide repeat-containing protein At1g71460, chloroplastic n=1 Tax=Gastrolobium bilobum TaxID=150636 RepID=UPI002AB224C7|nr:pentatricopeptide repeat-containing protein At1g71460, chloroplastic [Gastrolobium bilobum]
MENSVTATASLSLQLHRFSSNFQVFCFKPSTQSPSPPPPKSPTTTTTTTHHRNVPKITTKKNNNKYKVKPFKEKDVFPCSLPLHTKNPRSIYKDIKRFARENKLKEALTIMDYVDQQGIPVNITTFSSLIAACIRTNSISQGREVHTHIRINGLENNDFLRTKLVHMYTSCGSLEEARKVFDGLPCWNVYPWNALLRGTVISGKRQYIDVLNTYSEMRSLGVELNVYSFSSVIKSFAGAPALFQGLKTHALLIKNGLVDSSILRTSLIDMYFKCGKVKLAHRVFEEISDRDVVVWGAMLAGFAHNRLQREVLEYVRWMVEEGVDPNSVIMATVIPVIGEVSAIRLGQEVHAYVMKAKWYSKQLPIQSALIDMYCKCGDMSSARRIFYSTLERNVVCWTALMSGYASNGRLEQALRSTIWMQQEGFRPDVVTVATVLPICAQLRALEQGKQIHAYALKHWFLPNVSITSSLMMMYSKCGVIEYSVRLFDNMERRNVISWTSMIDSYVENGYLYEALGVIRSMQLSKHRPDSVAIARMLSVCGGLKLIKLGKEIHGQFLKRAFESVHFVSAELINMYGTFGYVNKAKLVFNAVPVKGSMTWTALIRAYGYNELYQDAINIFDQMRSNGFSPTHFTFEAILSICDRAGFVDDACRIFNIMPRCKIDATKEHFNIMIRLLTRYGQLEKAQRFVQMSSSL